MILHGLFGMLDNWQTAAKILKTDFQCILVDLRNHGKSPHAEEMNYHAMAGDIGGLINDLQLHEVYLMGHSMGGKVAMQFAISNAVHVKKLVVVDISPRAYGRHHDHVLKAIQSIDPGRVNERAEAETSFREHLGNDESTVQFLLKNLSRLPDHGFSWKANMPVLIRQYDELMRPVDHYQTFNKPVLFIRGEHSGSVRDEDWEGIIGLFPYARLVTIPGAGHWVHADAPGALTTAVSTFLISD